MIIALFAVLAGLLLLVWSADRFVDGSARLARHFGVSQLIVGMVIVGFGTSAPEMLVSVLASWQGNPGIALGNAYGSNIANIGLILGLTALLKPVGFHPQVIKREFPVLLLVTMWTAWLVRDGEISRWEAVMLLLVFGGIMGNAARLGISENAPENDEFSFDARDQGSLRRSVFWVIAGLIILIASSRLLVWGAVELAHAAGVSDLVIGLTIVAVGTSLPELASSLIAARRGEHDIALGNVLGSNLFNTMAVVGLAGTIHPMHFGPEVLSRDVLVMAGFTIYLLLPILLPGKRKNCLGRGSGLFLLLSYGLYTLYLVKSAFAPD